MDKYGLIGYPLSHSFSRAFFTGKFEQESIDAEYINFEIPSLDELKSVLADNPNLRGLNVTIPYKREIISYLDKLDSNAQQIGAVNVIKIERLGSDIQLVGYNSDVVGFQKSIYPMIDSNTHHKALILGTGGASKAINQALINLGLSTKYVSRTKTESNFCYQELTSSIIAEYTVIVNASPLGTYPKVNEAPAIPYEYLTPNHLVYDVVYNPAETLFLKRARQQGANVKNGAEMLLLQALEAWSIWNQKK